MHERVLVTGGTGFIGAHLVKKLVQKGAKVFVLNHPKVDTIRLNLISVLGSVCILPGDLYDRQSVRDAVKSSQPKTVYHLAARGVRAKDSDLSAIAKVNIIGSANILESCKEFKVKRLVWMGSGFEYSKNISGPIDENGVIEPVTWYGATKVASWELARYFNREIELELVTLRLFSAFGPMEHLSRFIPYVITRMIENKPVELTSGEQERDYLYVDDIINALVLLGEKPGIDGEVYNLGSRKTLAIKEIAQLISCLVGSKSELKIGVRQKQRQEASRLLANTTKIEKLGWKCLIDLREGLEKTINWYRESQNIWERII